MRSKIMTDIKEYVNQHSPNYTTLQNAFDKSLQGSLNVVELLTKEVQVQ